MISVIVPIYNVEKYLDRCLGSIAGQTYTNFEAFLINDGSTDGSATIAKQYAKIDLRFHYIEQENQGLSISRNKGLALAKGEYVSFIDSDDYISNDYFEDQITTAMEGNFDIVGSCVQKHRRGKLSPLWQHPQQNIQITPSSINQLECWVHSRLFRKSMIDRLEAKFIKGVIFEDIPFSWETLIQAGKLGIAQKGYYAYNRDNRQAITRNILDKSMDLIFVLDHTKHWLKENNHWQDYQYAWLQKALSTAVSNFKYMNNKKEFILHLKSLLQNDSFDDARAHLSPFEYKMYDYLINNKERSFYSYYSKEKFKAKITRQLKIRNMR